MKEIINEMRLWRAQFAPRLPLLKKYCLILSAIYILGIISILRANYNYMDDFGRVLYGYTAWDDFSRYLSVALSLFLHADGLLNDISPLPQVLAAFIMGGAGALLIDVFSAEKKFSWFKAAALVPLGLSPYFLECFSFKFDAPYMAVSVFAAVFPLAFFDAGKKLAALSIFLGTLVMCLTYQASSGIYPLAVFFLVAMRWNEGRAAKTCARDLAHALGIYALSLLFYRFAIMKTVEDYASTVVLGDKSVCLVVLDNIKTFFSLLKVDATEAWLIICATLCFCFLRSFVSESVRNKISALGVGIALLLLCSTLSFGVYLILQKPLFYPRAMYGIGAFFAVISLLALRNTQINYLSKLVSIALAWSMFVFSLAYGNCLAEQRRYDNFRVQLLINDLNKLPNLDQQHIRKIQLQGTAGYSPVVHRVSERYKVLKRLIHESLSSDFCFGEFYLYEYFNLPGINPVDTWGEDKRTLYEKDVPIFLDTAYHRIKADDRSVIVKLKEPAYDNLKTLMKEK